MLFTDGLVEDRHESLSVGLHRLLGDVTRVRDAASACGDGPDAAHEGAERTLLRAVGGPPDVAVLDQRSHGHDCAPGRRRDRRRDLRRLSARD